ncbi:MAG: YCF48-related protein [Nitrospirota bacterium]
MWPRRVMRGVTLIVVGVLLGLAAGRPVTGADARAVAVVQKSGTEVTLLGVFFRNANMGWAVGAGGAILNTADGGKRWKPVSSGTTVLLTGVFFADALHGWVVGANGTILHSKDGGEK